MDSGDQGSPVDRTVRAHDRRDRLGVRDPDPTVTRPRLPADHHADVSGGWLRAAVFGAMDGLVSNIGLIAGVGGGGGGPKAIVITGTAGLGAGAGSVALGGYSSVRRQTGQ